MSWSDLSGFSTFEKARRKELARRLTRIVRGPDSDNLLPLDEVRGRLELFEQWYAGIQSIPVSMIIGSVDRATDFDRDFLPKRRNMERRWKGVEEAFRVQAFPPIVVFKVGGAYFVEDGHHRVAIARQRKADFIDAEVTEVKSPVPISADTDVADIVHMGLRRWFMHESGLGLVRPQAEIAPSRPHDYAELLHIVHASGFELMIERHEALAGPVVAAHWHDHIFQPVVESIRRGKLPTIFPRATPTDLYLRVHSQRRELAVVGAATSVDDAVASAQEAASHDLKARTRLAIDKAKEAVTPDPQAEDEAE